MDKCIAALRGTKKIDLFQPARIDREVSVEDTMRTLVEMLHEGKFDHIGLSECRADTLRRGHAVRACMNSWPCVLLTDVYRSILSRSLRSKSARWYMRKRPREV